MSQSGWETQEKQFWEHFFPLVETPFILNAGPCSGVLKMLGLATPIMRETIVLIFWQRREFLVLLFITLLLLLVFCTNSWLMHGMFATPDVVFPSRGVHELVRVRSVPNPQPTRWHRVSGEKTCRRPQKPTGQVGLDWKDRRSSRSKPTKCCRRFLLGSDLYFLPDLRQICAKLTIFEQKTSNSRRICAKLTRSEQKKSNILWICAKLTRSEQKIGHRWAKLTRFKQNPTYFHRI